MSTPAVVAIAFLSVLAGIAIGGWLVEREHQHEHAPADVAHEWGEIEEAASRAYRGAHAAAADIGEHRSMTLEEASAAVARAAQVGRYTLPRLLVTCDAWPQGTPGMLDVEASSLLMGVDGETVMRALGRIPAAPFGPTICWGDPLPPDRTWTFG